MHEAQGRPCVGEAGCSTPYHERQVGARCAMHAANAVLGYRRFSFDDFRGFAADVNTSLSCLLWGNVISDDIAANNAGGFSVHTLEEAFGSIGYDMDRVPVERAEATVRKGVPLAVAAGGHWFAVVWFKGQVWTVDSLQDAPGKFDAGALKRRIESAPSMGGVYAISCRADRPTDVPGVSQDRDLKRCNGSSTLFAKRRCSRVDAVHPADNGRNVECPSWKIAGLTPILTIAPQFAWRM